MHGRHEHTDSPSMARMRRKRTEAADPDLAAEQLLNVDQEAENEELSDKDIVAIEAPESY